jgi:REP element-mobilizing transposase RayT
MKPAHHRRSIRLPGYDYAQPGAYFVTICTKDREGVLGEVRSGQMVHSPFGLVVVEEWTRSASIRREIALDTFVVMPNHLHGIVFILEDASPAGVGAHGRAPLPSSTDLNARGIANRKARSIGSFVAGYKAAVTKRVNSMRGTPGAALWQRNYYEHVIRTEAELQSIREYIALNPLAWEHDEENPDRP